MTDDPKRAEAQCLVLRDCSCMDCSIVERLRATVGMSLEWAEQTLDILIRLDDDLKAFDATVKQQVRSLPLPESPAPGEPAVRISALEEIASQTEQSVRRLRDGVRDVMMSMQNQDVIGQAVERAAKALEKRAAVIGRGIEPADCSHLRTNEIEDIHRAYRSEDDLHQAAGSVGDAFQVAA